MGSSSSKNCKASAKAGGARAPQSPTQPDGTSAGPSYPPIPTSQEALLAQRIHVHRFARPTRSDHPLLGLVRDNGLAASDKPRETRQEREARKLEKERQARLKERERSMREEHVDGGFLVTLGVYTGVEDFSKPVVRQLQIERRLAPFWRGLNEHSDAWTEAQLVAAARGLPIPAPDEIPPDMVRTYSEASSTYRGSETNSLTAPIPTRSLSQDTAASTNPPSIQPVLSSSGPASPTVLSPSSAQLLRGRAKTLASLATGSKTSLPDLTPQEIYLPKDPNVNGQPIEAYLYKDASECPICFMYYPPYLNRTRCCDQPICSECFVQIKRPDPHPPEHEQPGEERPPEEEAELLVSEVAACPFCVTPEFGITYDPPPFRRGLAHAKQANGHPLQNTTSAMSSSSSLNATGRRRTTSLSAQAPQVITTDRVRPDWAKKLADARAHVLRRSAAATALHNAAYVLGNQGSAQFPNLPGFLRRRSLFGDLTGTSSDIVRGPGGGLVVSPYEQLSRTAPADTTGDGNISIYPPRGSSRRTRVDDLEDLMMMEAIRQSLAAEEERKRKEDKEAKKEAKKKAKEQKKLVKKGGGSTSPVYQAGSNESASTMESADMARSTSNLGAPSPTTAEPVLDKGKQPAQDFAGFIPLTEPTSTFNTELRDQENPDTPARSRTNTFGSMSEDAQKHLEESRANLHPANGIPVPAPRQLSPHARQASDTLSIPSSRNESPSPSGSIGGDSSTPSLASGSHVDVSSAATHDAPAAAARSGTPPSEPVLNFRSLTAMIEDENKDSAAQLSSPEHPSQAEEALKEPSPTGSPRLSPSSVMIPDATRLRGNSVESSSSSSPPPPPGYAAHEDEDGISPAPANAGIVVHDVDSKDRLGGGIDVPRDVRQATQ